jgi:hypothetical protein
MSDWLSRRDKRVSRSVECLRADIDVLTVRSCERVGQARRPVDLLSRSGRYRGLSQDPGLWRAKHLLSRFFILQGRKRLGRSLALQVRGTSRFPEQEGVKGEIKCHGARRRSHLRSDALIGSMYLRFLLPAPSRDGRTSAPGPAFHSGTAADHDGRGIRLDSLALFTRPVIVQSIFAPGLPGSFRVHNLAS